MSKINKIVIIGTGGHARPVVDVARQIGFDSIELIDLNYTGKNESILDAKVVGGPDVINQLDKSVPVFIAIGDNQKRQFWFQKIKNEGFEIPNLVHHTAILSNHTKLGQGVFINAGAIINSDVVINNGSIVNTGAIVDHESKLGSFVHLAPGVIVAGRVIIDDLTFVGAGSIIIDQIQIGSGVVIGANSTIIKNISANAKVVGISKLLNS